MVGGDLALGFLGFDKRRTLLTLETDPDVKVIYSLILSFAGI